MLLDYAIFFLFLFLANMNCFIRFNPKIKIQTQLGTVILVFKGSYPNFRHGC